MIPPDFWWLSETEDLDALSVRVAEAGPIGSNPDDVPSLTYLPDPIQLSALPDWVSSREGLNLHRSVMVYRDLHPTHDGPLVLDIDAFSGGSRDDAQVVTQSIAKLLKKWGVKQDDVRVLDSGMKGYNVELRPTAKVRGETVSQEALEDLVINALRSTASISHTVGNGVAEQVLIDPRHDYLRLWNTFNIWIDENGDEQRRPKQIVHTELTG